MCLTFGMSCLFVFNVFHVGFNCGRQIFMDRTQEQQHEPHHCHQPRSPIQKCISTYNNTRPTPRKLQRFLEKEAIIRATARHPFVYTHFSPTASPPMPHPCFRCAAVPRVAYTIRRTPQVCFDVRGKNIDRVHTYTKALQHTITPEPTVHLSAPRLLCS